LRRSARKAQIKTPTSDPFEDDGDSNSDETLESLPLVAPTTDEPAPSKPRTSGTEYMNTRDDSDDNTSGDQPEGIFGRGPIVFVDVVVGVRDRAWTCSWLTRAGR